MPTKQVQGVFESWPSKDGGFNLRLVTEDQFGDPIFPPGKGYKTKAEVVKAVGNYETTTILADINHMSIDEFKAHNKAQKAARKARASAKAAAAEKRAAKKAENSAV